MQTAYKKMNESKQVFNKIRCRLSFLNFSVLIKQVPNLALILGIVCCFTSCRTLEPDSSKYNFSDGYYFTRLNSKNKAKVYLTTTSDTIKVYPASIAKQIADTTKMVTVLFPPTRKPAQFNECSFTSQSFDLDILTVLFKYRFASPAFPGELNATFNGALYAGYRTDKYRLLYEQTPLRVQKRRIRHYGYSLGGIAGVGTARIDEYNTLHRLDYEYDGAVVFVGVAAIMGFNKINFSLTTGIDYLLDRNKNVWVHEGKPWLGIGIGLNLN